jgi:PAS domain S-box-containing protein
MRISDNYIRKIQESEQRYRTLVEGITDYAVFTLDPRGFITSWNPGAVKMKGYTSEEAVGSHFSMLYPEAAKERNEPMEHLHAALIEGSFRGEGLRITKQGQQFLADVYIRPIYTNNKLIGFAKVVSNLDEQKKLIQEVDIGRKEVSELKMERELREQFISTLSHDLRNPLAAAKLALDMIKKTPEDLDENIDRVKKLIDRTDKMIRDLLDANRIKVGKEIPLNIEFSDMIQIVKESIETFSATSPSTIEFIHEGKQIHGFWDKEGLKRVFENLVSNALKYGDRSKAITVSVASLAEQIVIRVHNFGAPIRPEEQLAIFEQFHRSEGDLEKEGWGLGLTLVKGLTIAHGGSIIVKSFPIEGTTFTVSLPLDARKLK